jgi:hypothetical protein
MLYNQPYGKPAEVTWGDTPYINGDPSTGTAGSIPPAASIEYPQREIVNVIRDAGLLTPSNADLHQLAKSIQSTLLYSDDDAGTANQYQVTQTPAPTSYFKYMTVVTKIGNTNTGASTLNCNALGPKPIVHVDGSILTSGELKVNSVVCFIYDGTNFQMVWSSASGSGSGGPIYLLAPKTFYVNYGTGDDTNYDGSAATFTAPNHGPYKTLQRATNEINKFNLNGYSVTVNVANSASYTYWYLPQPGGSGSVSWQGATPVTPSSVTVTGTNFSACIGTYCGLQFLDGFKLVSGGSTSGGDNLCAMNIGYASRVGIGHMEFGACSGSHMMAAGGAYIVPRSNITISGGCAGNSLGSGAHAYNNMSAAVGVNGLDLPIYSVTVACTIQYFVVSSHAGQGNLFWSGSITGYGNVTGTRYLAQMNGVIDSSGGGVNYYPGTIVGTTSSGGQYV